MTPCYYCEADAEICKTCIHSRTYVDPEETIERLTAQRDELVAALEQTLNQMRKWQGAYGKWQPEWLPPSYDVQVSEMAEDAIASVKESK